MTTPLIEARNLSFKRQGQQILYDISLSVMENDFTTIIGPNGAGKSLLLKLILGLVKPDSGEVIASKGLRVGYVPQRFTPDHSVPISVKDFLRLNLDPNPSQLSATIAETGIEKLLIKQLSTLSGGEMQRVLLARSLLNAPQLLVLDEPAQNLDITGQLEFYKLIDQLYINRGLSILMISHDLHIVMASTQKVICLYHHICCSGEPQAVARDPEFISLFGEDMAKMMAVYQHNHNHDHIHDHSDQHLSHHDSSGPDRGTHA